MKTLMKSFIMLFIAVILFSAGFIACRQDRLGDLSPTSSSVSVDRKELTSFLQKIYDIRYQSLYSRVDSSVVKQKLSGYFEPRALLQLSDDYLLNKKKVDYHYDNVDNNLGITKLGNIVIDSISIDGFKYKLSVSVYYSNDKQDSGRDIYNLIINEKSENSFTVDYIYRQPDIIDPDYLIKTRLEDDKISQSDKITPSQHKFMEDNYKLLQSYNKNSRVAASYSPVNAITYAATFATSRNKSYPVWGNDCTNFVSQCLKAGGWIEIGSYSTRTKTSDWYNTGTSLYSCYSWSAAHNFYNFCSIHPGRTYGYSVSSFNAKNYSVGDIVQIDYGKDGSINHAMIVVKNDGSNVYVAYHEPDTWYKNLSLIMAENKTTAYFYVWKVIGTNWLSWFIVNKIVILWKSHDFLVMGCLVVRFSLVIVKFFY